MERLGEQDLQAVRSFLGQASAPCDLGGFAAVILPAIQELVPGDIVCLSETDLTLQKSLVFETDPIGSHMDSELFDLYMFDHPVFQYWDSVGHSPTAATSQVASMRRWHQSALYQDVYRPLGLEDSLATGLPTRPGLASCICIERANRFSEHDRDLLEFVSPFISQLYRRAEMLSLVAGSPNGSVETMILDWDGRPLWAPQSAWQLLSRYSPAAVGVVGEFPAPVLHWLHSQLRCIRSGDELPSLAAPLVVTDDEGRTLTARLSPGARTGTQVLLEMRERPAPLDISPELGLSRREKEVLRLARRGLRNAEIADSMCISRRTVEKHFENVYHKLGVDGRTAAVAEAFLRPS